MSSFGRNDSSFVWVKGKCKSKSKTKAKGEGKSEMRGFFAALIMTSQRQKKKQRQL
jgi:hypothetical protein